jgi:predicted alpha/beta-fold hydrolase
MLALMWLRAMERYVQLCQMGMEMLAIRYASWLSAPRQTAEAMLEYCQCRPADMTAVYETLDKDSQAGTRLSREALEQRGRATTERDLEEFHWHLQHHAFIHEPDYEVPNTLKTQSAMHGEGS